MYPQPKTNCKEWKMSDLNHVSLVGRVTRDTELKYTVNGTPMCYFGVAVGRVKKVNEEWKQIPSFFNFTVFGKKAEGVAKYLVKGQTISLEGHLEEDRWSKDGVSHSKMVVAVDKIQIIGGLKKKDGGGGKAEPEGEIPGGAAEEEYPDEFKDIDGDFDLDGAEAGAEGGAEGEIF
jgi:single-strand DNA-binding protein